MPQPQYTAELITTISILVFIAVYSALIVFLLSDEYGFRLRRWWARRLGTWDYFKPIIKTKVIEMFKRFVWAPAIFMLWPFVWYDKRQRRLKKKPDKWYWADRYFSEKGIYFMTEGFFPWERY